MTTRSQLSSRLAIDLFTTVTSANPASWILLRSTDAPMAEEPMPASQATTIFVDRALRAGIAPARAVEATDFLPFIASMGEVRPIRSPSSVLVST